MNRAADFRRLGWGPLANFVETAELPALVAAVDTALARPGPSCMPRPGSELVSLRWSDPIVATLLGASARLDRLRALLGARDLRWLSGYVSTKPPHSLPLAWHQDWWCWDHPVSFLRAAPQVAVLCYLTDTSEDNGALRVLPGSHHRSVPLHRLLPEPHGAEDDAPRADPRTMADAPGQVTMPMRAGDAVVLDYRVLHGTHANRTARRRDCVLLSFLPDWQGLPPELRAHLILHPALPDSVERRTGGGLACARLMPRFEGAPSSRTVHRRPPGRFGAG